MKKRHPRLALIILLPTLLVILLGEVGVFFGAYFNLQSAAYDTAVERDKDAFDDFLAESSWDEVGYPIILENIMKIYDEYGFTEMPSPNHYQYAEYRDKINNWVNSQLYYYVRTLLNQHNSDFISLLCFDRTHNVAVVVATGKADYFKVDEPLPNFYPGYILQLPIGFDGESFGFHFNDPFLGDMFASSFHPSTDSAKRQTSREYYLVRETSWDNVYSVLTDFTWRFTSSAAVAVVLLEVVIYLLVLFLIIRPMKRLSRNGVTFVEGLSQGETRDVFVPSGEHGSLELSSLQDAFYTTQEAIKDYSARIKESAAYEQRVAADLALADRIQKSMVPNAPLWGKNFMIRGFMKPAKEVGGDLYNYYVLDDDHLVFFIGDVSGKGVPAALFMAKANAVLQMALKDFDIDAANNMLSKDNTELFFVTAFIANLELSTGKLRYVNAGHEQVFLYHRGKYKLLDEEPNFMLGYIPDMNFVVQETTLSPGDRLFLYTDGISEAMDVNGGLFGKQRIEETLNQSIGLPSGTVFALMERAIADFVGEAEQSDDACMVALDYCHESTLEFSIDLDGLAKVVDFADESLAHLNPVQISQIQVALDEICTNVVTYSHSPTPAKLTLMDDGKNIFGCLIDAGDPFDPTGTLRERGEDEPGGHGITLAKEMFTTLSYKRIRDWNVLFFSKKYR